jgi:hypothetical protein
MTTQTAEVSKPKTKEQLLRELEIAQKNLELEQEKSRRFKRLVLFSTIAIVTVVIIAVSIALPAVAPFFVGAGPAYAARHGLLWVMSQIGGTIAKMGVAGILKAIVTTPLSAIAVGISLVALGSSILYGANDFVRNIIFGGKISDLKKEMKQLEEQKTQLAKTIKEEPSKKAEGRLTTNTLHDVLGVEPEAPPPSYDEALDLLAQAKINRGVSPPPAAPPRPQSRYSDYFKDLESKKEGLVPDSHTPSASSPPKSDYFSYFKDLEQEKDDLVPDPHTPSAPPLPPDYEEPGAAPHKVKIDFKAEEQPKERPKQNS